MALDPAAADTAVRGVTPFTAIWVVDALTTAVLLVARRA